jgi:hypothetical protein
MLRNNGRRVLFSPAWSSAKELFANISAERDQLRRELFERDRELEWAQRDLTMAQESVREHRAAIADLLATRRNYETARAELVKLYRERDIERAREAARDSNQPLQ